MKSKSELRRAIAQSPETVVEVTFRQRRALDAVRDQNRRRGYPTGAEWGRLMDIVTDALSYDGNPKGSHSD